MPSILSTHTIRLRNHYAHNLATFRRQPLAEISGSLGDLGTFLPLLIALASNHAVSLSTTLILTGFYNIATGLFFGIPLPVQPMKAIAAVAILKGMSAGEVAAAGLFVGGVIGLLSITGLLELVTRWVPVPVVKGIQVGAGLSLVVAAGTKAVADLGWTGPSWADNRLWIVVAFVGLLSLNCGRKMARVPFALLVTVVGVVFAVVSALQAGRHLPGFRTWRPRAAVPKSGEWRVGILDAGLGQLPLTTLNSIIAVTHLAGDLLPEVETPSVTMVGVSVAAMNLIGCWFGGMPACHGSGGLAAQYKFGARSGASIIILGILKLVLGLVFGNSLTELLDRFPIALLTVMVIAAGLELVSVGESLNNATKARDLKGNTRGISDEESKERWSIMMLTAGFLLAFKNDGVGFLAGMLCHYSFQLPRRLAKKRQPLSDHEQRPLLS